MESIIVDKLDDTVHHKHHIIEWVEVVLGIGACMLMVYFFHMKGYWELMTQIWGSFFG
jgi:hypothetical protein